MFHEMCEEGKERRGDARRIIIHCAARDLVVPVCIVYPIFTVYPVCTVCAVYLVYCCLSFRFIFFLLFFPVFFSLSHIQPFSQEKP